VRQHGERGEQLRLDLLRTGKPIGERRPLVVDERVGRLEARVERSNDEVLALAGEQPEPLARTPPLELANQLEARVGG